MLPPEGFPEKGGAVPAEIEGGPVHIFDGRRKGHETVLISAMVQVKEMTHFMKGHLGRPFKHPFHG